MFFVFADDGRRGHGAMELAEAIQSDFIRFEPFLRRTIQSFVLEFHPELDNPSSSTPYNQTYFRAVHKLPTEEHSLFENHSERGPLLS